ncbi:MAG: molybdenum cofactor biosynthesis protein [Alphaproteobacteria bacterium BRH_c36]|nr:MAG: molybdenum cofactor biosynthesis protein [Alphaproteobacteria bacterium BRH_c36]
MTKPQSTQIPQPPNEDVTAAVLVIGDEILSGRTKEANAGYIADVLTAAGIRLREVRVVADDQTDIVDALNALRVRYTYVFTTGGIGPTHDDITADCIAKAFGVAIDVDERALARMMPYYESRGLELTPSRLRMARLPKGADLINNRITAAPGFKIGNVFVMAGVPSIMQAMLDEILPGLRTGRKMLSQSIKVLAPESEVADLFADHQKAFPAVIMGSYPSFAGGLMRCELVLRSIDAEALSEADDALRQKLTNVGIPIAKSDS